MIQAPCMRVRLGIPLLGNRGVQLNAGLGLQMLVNDMVFISLKDGIITR